VTYRLTLIFDVARAIHKYHILMLIILTFTIVYLFRTGSRLASFRRVRVTDQHFLHIILLNSL